MEYIESSRLVNLITAVFKKQTNKPPTQIQLLIALKMTNKWLSTVIGNDSSDGICTKTLGTFIQPKLKSKYTELSDNMVESIQNVPIRTTTVRPARTITNDLPYIN